MKVNILVGVRFQAGQLAKVLMEVGHDLNIYSSSPAKKWRLGESNNHRIHFVPMLANIFHALTKRQLPYWIREWSIVLFDVLCSIFMTRSDILHAWSSFGLISIRKAKRQGSMVFVEKSCPHPNFQNKLLDEEAVFLGVKRRVYSDAFTVEQSKSLILLIRLLFARSTRENPFLKMDIVESSSITFHWMQTFTLRRTTSRIMTRSLLRLALLVEVF